MTDTSNYGMWFCFEIPMSNTNVKMAMDMFAILNNKKDLNFTLETKNDRTLRFSANGKNADIETLCSTVVKILQHCGVKDVHRVRYAIVGPENKTDCDTGGEIVFDLDACVTTMFVFTAPPKDTKPRQRWLSLITGKSIHRPSIRHRQYDFRDMNDSYRLGWLVGWKEIKYEGYRRTFAYSNNYDQFGFEDALIFFKDLGKETRCGGTQKT